ncbi:hypothetical protein IC582_010783 [Cucumis melo]
MGKGPSLYSDIARKLEIFSTRITRATMNSPSLLTLPVELRILGIHVKCAISSTGVKKGDIFLVDVSTQLKNNNITTDVKVGTHSNVHTIVTIDELAPGLKTIFSFRVPNQRFARLIFKLNSNINMNMLEEALALV